MGLNEKLMSDLLSGKFEETMASLLRGARIYVCSGVEQEIPDNEQILASVTEKDDAKEYLAFVKDHEGWRLNLDKAQVNVIRDGVATWFIVYSLDKNRNFTPMATGKAGKYRPVDLLMSCTELKKGQKLFFHLMLIKLND